MSLNKKEIRLFEDCKQSKIFLKDKYIKGWENKKLTSLIDERGNNCLIYLIRPICVENIDKKISNLKWLLKGGANPGVGNHYNHNAIDLLFDYLVNDSQIDELLISGQEKKLIGMVKEILKYNKDINFISGTEKRTNLTDITINGIRDAYFLATTEIFEMRVKFYKNLLRVLVENKITITPQNITQIIMGDDVEIMEIIKNSLPEMNSKEIIEELINTYQPKKQIEGWLISNLISNQTNKPGKKTSRKI